MDKRLVGKWINEEWGEVFNIFDETPPRMKLTFKESGHFNFEPNCVYEKDGWFCFEINDDEHREVYRLKADSERLCGCCVQFGREREVEYIKISDTPEDGEYRYHPFEIYLPDSDKTRLEVLREHAEFDRNKEETYGTEYALYEEVPPILEKYGYSSYIDGIDKSTDCIVFKIFDFVCDHFGHNGQNGRGDSSRLEGLIGFCETNGMKTNCRGLAMILSAILRLNGIKARHITCMPYENPFSDCHVVTDCLMPSGKRIMLDPSFRLWFTDENGEYVSLPELRERLINGEELAVNKDASYNGGEVDLTYYRNYMTKNTFRFSRGTYFADGYDEGGRQCVALVPINYDMGVFSDAEKKQFVYNDMKFWEM